MYHLSPLPLLQSNLIRFVAHLARIPLAPSTIRVYLSGLRSWAIDLGLPLPEVYTPAMSQALKALERHHVPNQAPPILHAHLFSIISSVPCSRDNLMAMGAMTLAFFACLRPSEYLLTRGVLSPPSRSDVIFARDFTALDYTVHRSKTSPKGFQVHVGCSRSPVCAVCIIRSIVYLYPASPSSPLFLNSTNTPLSYSDLAAKLAFFLRAIGLDPTNFTPHSLRAGSATAAAAAGCSEQEIQKLGRWASLCYRRYIRPSKQLQAQLAPKLASAPLSNHLIP